MQYIKTKFLGPTNFRGSRVKASASCCPTTITIPWAHADNWDDNHHAAAKMLAQKLGWAGYWVEGGGNHGNVYVCIERAAAFIVDPKKDTKS
jgi:hypothetical protein